MWSVNVAGGSAVSVFVSGVLGLWIQTILPKAHTSDRSRDIIGGIVGLLTLLLALVLGLLMAAPICKRSNCNCFQLGGHLPNRWETCRRAARRSHSLSA